MNNRLIKFLDKNISLFIMVLTGVAVFVAPVVYTYITEPESIIVDESEVLIRENIKEIKNDLDETNTLEDLENLNMDIQKRISDLKENE